MDRILIRELVVEGILGVHEYEREQPRTIVIDLDLYLDLTEVGLRDELAAGLDYEDVVETISEHVAGLNRFTLEAVATDVAELALGFPGVKKVRVLVQKPNALEECRSVGVEIERSAKEPQMSS